MRNIEKILQDKCDNAKWKMGEDTGDLGSLIWNVSSFGYNMHYKIVGYFDFTINETLYYGQFISSGEFYEQMDSKTRLEDAKQLCYNNFIERIARLLEITEDDFELEEEE